MSPAHTPILLSTLLAASAAMAEPPAAPQPAVNIAATTPAVTASNAFGIDLYRAIAASSPGDNLFLSPYSMSVALTMAAEGARGQTEAEMARVLHLGTARSPSDRAITAIHAAHAALARRFREAAGSTDPKLRAQLAKLREELDQANERTRKLESGDDWRKAGESQQKAQELASQINALQATLDRFDLRTANALWVEQTFSLVPDYIKTISQFYTPQQEGLRAGPAAGLQQLNFLKDPEASRARINTWVEEQTEHRIKDLIPAGGINPDTRLVITNAIYFKGEWAQPFLESSTLENDFTRADASTVKVQMMNAWNAAPYAAFTGDGELFITPHQVPRDESKRPATYPGDDGFQIMSKAYKGNELSMVLIAPRTPGGLPALESRLTASALDGWLGKMEHRSVTTAIPRFKLESKYTMSSILQDLGMKRAFANPGYPSGAEFPGMSASEDPTQQLFIGAVLHKAFVEVTEKGTEAAAATAVMMMAGAAAKVEEMVDFTPVFRADRPFIFLIRDNTSGAILFMGRMMNPPA